MAQASSSPTTPIWSTQLDFDNNGTAWSESFFAGLAADGLTTAELNMPWGTIEPSAGTFSFAEFDAELAIASAAGIQLIPIFWQAGWGGSPAPWISDFEEATGGAAGQAPTWWDPTEQSEYFTYVTDTIQNAVNQPGGYGGAILDYGFLDAQWDLNGAGGGYAADDISEFQNTYLPQTYGTIATFNSDNGTSYSAFSQVPAAAPGQALFGVFQAFRAWSVQQTYGQLTADARAVTASTPLYFYFGGGFGNATNYANDPDTFFQLAKQYNVTVIDDDASSQGLTLTFGSFARAYGVKVAQEWTAPPSNSQLAAKAVSWFSLYAMGLPQGGASGTLSLASNAPGSPLTVALSGAGTTSTTNLALNKPVSASSSYQSYVPGNVTDGNTSSYCESTDGAGYPQTITVNLGSAQSIGSVTLDLPPASAWSTRTETLSIVGSTSGSSFSQLVGSAGYTFNPSTRNTVTISLPSGTSAQYVELSFTGNTGWPAAQLSEFEVFPGGGSSGGPGSALTASPSSLAFGNETVGSTSASQTVTVSNPNSTAVSVSQLAVNGPFGHTTTCGATIPAAGSCTVSIQFVPTATGTITGSLSITSSAPGSPLTVALTGAGTASSTTDLALNASVTASSYTQTYVPANTVDGNISTYWEATDGVWPSTITVNLGSSQVLGSIAVDLPPSSAWQTRSQALSVLGSTNGTSFATLVGSAAYTWNPSSGNSVTIPLPSGTTEQYVELSYTANNVQNGAQASEIEIFG